MIFLIFVVLNCIGLGCIQKQLPNASFGLQLAFSTLIFLLWMCFGGVFLGYFCILHRWSATIWIGLFILFSTVHIHHISIPKHGIDKIQIIILSCCTFIYGILATPPVWYRDTLAYHLTLPKIWSSSGGYQQTDQILFEYFPSLWQWGLSFLFVFGKEDNPVFHPRYIGIVITLMTSLIIGEIIKDLFQKNNPQNRYLSKYYKNIGILCYLLIPTVIEFGTSVYVMPWLSFLCITSVYLYIHQSIQPSRFGFLFEIIIGAAIISSKYSGLIWIFCLICLKTTTQRRNKILQYGCFVGCTGSFFYIRNFLIHNNPVFPKLSSIFGSGFFGEWRSWAYDITLQDYGSGRDFFDYCLLPFRMFSSFDLQYGFQGSLGLSIGILFTLCLYHNRNIRYLLIPWFLLWAVQVQQIRFFIPAVGVIVIYGLIKIPQNRLWILASLSIIWSIYPIQHLWKRQQGFDYWTKYVDERDFLRTQLPENYPIDEYINSMESHKKVWYVWMRGYTYYSPKEIRVDSVFGAWRFEKLLEQSERPTDVVLSLHRDNISHVVINHRFFLVDGNADLQEGRTEKLQLQFQLLIEDDLLIPVHQIKSVVIYKVTETNL